jgi:hypothetical protein
MTIGVPVGAQTDELLCTTSGCPSESTRVVPESHWPVTQGPFAVGGGGNAQPAMTQGEEMSTLGAPLSMTRGLGTVGVACPPWEHSTCAPA